MGTNLHFLTNSLLAVVCAVMGTSFLSLHVPKKEGLKNYRISLKVLSGAYFTLSILTIAVLVFDLADNSREYFTFISIFISSTQALLFTFTLITLINPKFVTIRNLLKHLIPYFFILPLYFVSFLVFDDPKINSLQDLNENLNNPTVWIRVLLLIFFFFQLVYYTILFLREEKKYDDELYDYFSEVIKLRMNWVKFAFFSALAIGITAMLSSFFPKHTDWIVTTLYSSFYFIFAQEYIKYNKVFSIVEPAINAPVNEVQHIHVRTSRSDWEHFKQQILSNKQYLVQGITIEEIASSLKISRTTLSNLINREEKVNFNTWINRLRIEDAKNLMIHNPDYTILQISEMVGYTEQANFSRQFKQITGESPLVWRKKSAS